MQRSRGITKGLLPHRALCELTQLAEWYIEGKKSIWTLKVKIRHRTVVW